ncbi:hypothetical protein MCOR24_000306 [Pyricularia oryzae]|nr:hypothetical protein MCOR24_000306 [Pyricularia oryzae]
MASNPDPGVLSPQEAIHASTQATSTVAASTVAASTQAPSPDLPISQPQPQPQQPSPPLPTSPSQLEQAHAFAEPEVPPPLLPTPKSATFARSTQGGSSRRRRRSRSRNRAGTATSANNPYFPGDQASTRRLRYSIDEYEDEGLRNEIGRHPDGRSMPRARPPRAYLNHPAYANLDSPAKPYTEDPKGHREFDYEVDPNTRQQYEEEYAYGTGVSHGPGMAGPQPFMRFGPTSNASHYGPDSQAPRINWKDLSREERTEVLRLPWTQWMNSNVKNHFVAMLGELIGTTMFLFFAFAGVEVANIGLPSSAPFNLAKQLYISLSFGFSLMVNVWIFFRISGAQFNPAVTLALWMTGAVDAVRGVCLVISQLCGGMLASVIVRFLFPQRFSVRTSLSQNTSLVQGVFIEALLTSELVFTILMLAKEKHKATYMAPVGIGLALWIDHMVGVPFTGAGINPARSFGPCVVTATFEPEHWIYWVGPGIGALIAVAFYKLIKVLEYEMANPGADGDADNDPTQNPAKRAELAAGRRVSFQEPASARLPLREYSQREYLQKE